MVLHHRKDYFVAFFQEGFSEGISHKIYALCGATRENDFARAASIYKLAHSFARCLMQLRSLLRKIVNPSVHIGVHLCIFTHNGINHTLRLLRCGSIVKVNKRMLVDLSRKYWKILTIGVHRNHKS